MKIKTVKYKVVHSLPEASQPGHKTNTATRNFVIDEITGLHVVVTARLLERSLGVRLRKYGVPIGHWQVLLFLFAEDGLSQVELSRRLGVERATVTRTIDRMERDGLVKRVEHPMDKRRNGIYLTPHAKVLKDKLVGCAVEAGGILQEALGTDNIARLKQNLRAIQSAVREDLRKRRESEPAR
jgi:DNA-binding MarR family transcriptional regulator